jgi:hypothetical protein
VHKGRAIKAAVHNSISGQRKVRTVGPRRASARNRGHKLVNPTATGSKVKRGIKSLKVIQMGMTNMRVTSLTLGLNPA